ncbi:bifunctional folylpolyglutamate synthase/dihydrofolate synthase [Sphingomonas sp. RB1R13]|uniref:bifunctional folylpolyglutamate synthase/dihydrofolate synthase n=1 Tax=Sphingomonas sp. RB1R13 TaxID=3096159 RepID=UPI002FCCA859
MADFARSSCAEVQAQLERMGGISSGDDTLGLERIAALLDRLGRPQDRLPPVLHVAGTNGKGSTCAFLRAGIEAAGLSAHVFISPHLVRYNERIRIGGQLIDDDALAALLAEVIDANDGIGGSFFEVTTAAALLAFARVRADACILEVGLGGRLDASNVVDRPAACGIASIGIDHQHYLGHSLAEIAREKAGIAKAGVPLIVLAQVSEALAAIEAMAAERGAPVLLEWRDWLPDASLRPTLPGAHQRRNANLAWQMILASGLPVSIDQFRSGLASARWPARLQQLAPGPLAAGRDVIVDGAHNVDAAAALALHLASDPRHLVLGMLANKDADEIVALLAPHALSLTFVAVPDHASHDPVKLAARFGGRAGASLADALAPLPSPILIAGSLYLAGDALAANGELPD